MDDLTVCRLSAEALGKKIRSDTPRVFVGDRDPYILWNPLLYAEQRWECVEWLLKQGWRVEFGQMLHCITLPFERPEAAQGFDCPASEFPARAVAELQRRKEKANG